jgi:aspartate carbamoyltransferase catalytic subunit
VPPPPAPQSAESRPRSLVSIDDLSNDEILELFRHAEEFRADIRAWTSVCRGSIMATLFFEPSTRTRLSFESAMQRLGGGVLTAAEAQATSKAKGETLADTVRVVGGGYADLLVVRHAEDGAARVAARYARVPIVNGGDGAHEHPTQTLCDLYTLWQEKGRLEGLDVALCGDLRFGRTVHSLAYALARFGANVVTLPHAGFEMPASVLDRLERDCGVRAIEARVPGLEQIAEPASVRYLTGSRPHQLALFSRPTPIVIERLDAVYMTRSQQERHDPGVAGVAAYPRLTTEILRAPALQAASVLHPLPRVDEIAYEVDNDPRALYFRQAELGVPMRMALLAFLLGRITLRSAPPARFAADPARSWPEVGLRCANPRCITNGDGRTHLPTEWFVREVEPPRLVCAFCGHSIATPLVGHARTRRVQAFDAPEARRTKPENRVYFESLAQARAAGFEAPESGPPAG